VLMAEHCYSWTAPGSSHLASVLVKIAINSGNASKTFALQSNENANKWNATLNYATDWQNNTGWHLEIGAELTEAELMGAEPILVAPVLTAALQGSSRNANSSANKQ
jgi:hypothetical protein